MRLMNKGIIPHLSGYNRHMIGRFASRKVLAALQDTPVVLLQGPRQSGKSTLAQRIAQERFAGNYITLDDPIALAEARRNPASFLRSRKPPLVIDEVQRTPELFLALKLFVDQDRRAGQFLLTGSANVLLLPKVADSLAGRMEPIELAPFTQAELEGSEQNFVDRLFSAEPFAPTRTAHNADDLARRIARGGFPEPASRDDAERREAWYQAYVRTILDRDVRDLANISGLTQMPRLLALLAARSGQTLNLASLALETGVPHTTLTRYVDLFKALFLLTMTPAWSAQTETRLAKSPKAYIVDTGLICYLTGMDQEGLGSDPIRFDPAVETFVLNELHRLAAVSRTRPWLFHLRTVKQKEVDFVLEGRDGRVVGVEVRTTQAVQPSDLEGLQFLADIAEHRFHRGVVLYNGPEIQHLGENLFAVPISMLWS
jgi:uncharacterized protein